jgi:hypothetical protein
MTEVYRATRSSESGIPPAIYQSAEEHSPAEIAHMWGLSTDSVRRLFRNEPGVLAISPRQSKGKRAYLTLRIPQSVLERVHRKWILVRW